MIVAVVPNERVKRMSNKSGHPIKPTIQTWFKTPLPQYVPLSDVAFGPYDPVLPHPLPPTAMVFPNASFNKMLNIPSTAAIYDTGRTGRIF